MANAELAGWVGVAVGVVSVLVTVAIAVIKRQRKIFAYEAYVEFPLLFVNNPISSEIEVSANGRRISSPHILIVTMKNVGNRAIRPEDFYDPIRVNFCDAELISIKSQSDPVAAGGSARILDKTAFEVEPVLLNSNDGIVFYGLLDGCPHRLTVTARLADTVIQDATGSTFTQSLLKNISVKLTIPFGPTIEISRRPSPASRVPASNTESPERECRRGLYR